jgi:hypothetical protein
MAEKDKAKASEAEEFIDIMSRATESTRMTIAQQLKDAGLYKGKITGEFNTKFYTALMLFGSEFTLDQNFKKQYNQPKVSITDFLQNRAAEGLDSGTGTGPTTTVQTYVTSPSQTAKLINDVAKDLLGRELTSAERAKYTKLINAEQKKQPSVQTSGKGFSTTRGGIDETQFITEQIGNTAEAKTNQATDAYAIMMEELGGLG